MASVLAVLDDSLKEFALGAESEPDVAVWKLRIVEPSNTQLGIGWELPRFRTTVMIVSNGL